MASRLTLGGLAVFAIVAAVLWIPWATKERVIIASTPVPPPLVSITPAPLKGGSTACLDPVTFSARTKIGEIGLTTNGKPGPRLDIRASAPGYRAAATIPAGYKDDPAAQFRIAAAREPVLGKLCIRNTGRRAISLDGTNEFRTMGRPQLLIDGVAQPMDAKLIFYDTVLASYASRIGEIFSHAAVFTPAFFSKAVLIALGVLALFGIPVAMAMALSSSAREDDRRAE